MQRLVITTTNTQHIVFEDQIISCHFTKAYALLKLTTGETIYVDTNTHELKIKLQTLQLFKTGKNAFINIEQIKKVSTKDNVYLVMRNNDRIPITPKVESDLYKAIESIQ